MTAIQYIHIAFELWGAVFCSIAAACVYVTRRMSGSESTSLLALLMTETSFNVFEALAYYYRGNETDAGFIMVRAVNFIVFISGYLLAFFAFQYMTRIIEGRGGGVGAFLGRAIRALCGTGILLLIASRFYGFYYAFDEHNRYYRLDDTYWIMPGIGILMLWVLFSVTLQNCRIFRKAEFAAFLMISLAPAVGLVVQVLYYGVSIVNFVNTVMILLLFVVHELNLSAAMLKRERETSRARLTAEHEKVKLLEKQAALDRVRLRMYQGQIPAHFIFNSLSVIRGLMRGKSEAKDALDQFSRFLRESADMLMQTECVSSEREFKTVELYLMMQKRRFGEKLNVTMEPGGASFPLPAFAVQTLVENAVTHGIRKTADGCGHLTVRAYETEREHIIEVSDDGAGFDTSILDAPDAGEAHLGLANLRERLSLMCGGTLAIKSAPGEGTVAKVRIPK